MNRSPHFPRTLPELVRTAIAVRGDATAFLVHREGRWASVSGDEAFRSIERIAAGLVSRGVSPGDRVVLLSWNRIEWTLTDLAISGIGAVTVPIYPNLPHGQVKPILANSAARIVFAENAEQYEKVDRASDGSTAVESVLAFERTCLPDDVRDLADLEARGGAALRDDPELWERRAAAVRPEHLASLVYTSGSTGLPKGVRLTHGNLCANIEGCLRRLSIVPEDLAISFLPLAHVFERTVGYIYLVAGARIAYARSINRLPEDLRSVSPTVMVTVPRVLEKIRDRIHSVLARKPAPLRAAAGRGLRVGAERGDRVRDGDRVGPWLALRARLADALVLRRVRAQLGGRVQCVISGGAPLSLEVSRFFWGAGVRVVEGYGLTETSPVLALNPLHRCRLGTVGPPLDNVELRIGDDGEILARGPSVSGGYWEAPDATAEAFRDGWFHSGDIGEIDHDGYLRITGRKKELLVTSGGKNVAQRKIETLLQESPLIARALVVGDGRPYLVALLVPVEEALDAVAHEERLEGLRGRALREHPAVLARVRGELDRLQSGLASYETVKRFHLLERDLRVEDGLLTPKLTVRRPEVERVFADAIERLYAGAGKGARYNPGRSTC